MSRIIAHIAGLAQRYVGLIFKEVFFMRQLANEEPQQSDVTITVMNIEKESPKAICVLAPNGRPVWFPRSVVMIQHRLDSANLDIIVQRWFWDKEELEGVF